MTEQTSGVSRRTLAKGAAWAAPVVAVGATAPAYASSLGATGRFRVDWGAAEGTSWTGNRTFSAYNIDGRCAARPIVYTVSVNLSVQRGEPTARNLTVGTEALWSSAVQCHRINFGAVTRFAPYTMLVLNQSGYHQSGTTDTSDCGWSGVIPLETLTFTVRDPNGDEVATTNCDFWVQDISATARLSGGKAANGYWDAVVFPDSPDTITNGQAVLDTPESTQTPGNNLNTTSGVGPYHTVAPGVPSRYPGKVWHHEFQMASGVPKTMQYTQFDEWGGQFIGVARIEFDAPCG